MNEFERKVEELKEVYAIKPDETINGINDLVFNLKFKSDRPFAKEIPKSFITGVYILIVLLLGLANLKDGAENMGAYYGGAAFFLAGLFVELNAGGMGIIFLFSHGCTGLALMTVPKVIGILNSPILTDGANNIKILLILSLALIVVGLTFAMLYGSSGQFKRKKYSLIITLSFFLIAIAIIQFLPIIYNIPIDSVF